MRVHRYPNLLLWSAMGLVQVVGGVEGRIILEAVHLDWQVDYNAALATICFMLFLGFADDVLDIPWVSQDNLIPNHALVAIHLFSLSWSRSGQSWRSSWKADPTIWAPNPQFEHAATRTCLKGEHISGLPSGVERKGEEQE